MITRRGLVFGLLALPAVRALGPLEQLLPTASDSVHTYGTATGEVFSLETIEAAIRKCREMKPVIKPFVGVDGKSYYVVLGPTPDDTRYIRAG